MESLLKSENKLLFFDNAENRSIVGELKMSKTERVGVSLDKKLLSMFDQLIAKQSYANRSEAIRDLIRNRLSEEQLADPTSQATAGVFLIYDHHATKLSQKLVDLQHNHLLEVIASTHVFLLKNSNLLISRGLCRITNSFIIAILLCFFRRKSFEIHCFTHP